jgi:hypothetical protein
MLDTIGDDTQSKRARFGPSVDLTCAIDEDAGQHRDFADPPTILFACNLDLDHGSILRPSGLREFTTSL